VMIKGSGFREIWPYILILFVMAVILITISLVQIDKRKRRKK